MGVVGCTKIVECGVIGVKVSVDPLPVPVWIRLKWIQIVLYGFNVGKRKDLFREIHLHENNGSRWRN